MPIASDTASTEALQVEERALPDAHQALLERHQYLEGRNQYLEQQHQLLEQQHQLLEQQHQLLEQQQQRYQTQLAQLQHELAQLKRLIYGFKSERFIAEGVADQLRLFDGGVPEESPASATAPVAHVAAHERQRRVPVRQALPSHLPREVITLEPEEDTRGLKQIGEEVSETLDYRPARLVVIQRVRPKYVDPQDEDRGVVMAPMPARVIDKGLAEAGLLAQVVIDKYVDHLPLYRQQQRYARQGITLSRSTLGDWVKATAEALAPLYQALVEQVRSSGYIQADETPIAVLEEPLAEGATDGKVTGKGKTTGKAKGKGNGKGPPGRGPGRTHRGYYWVYHAPEAGLVVMDYQPGRSASGARQMLRGYQGALQSDGYAVYKNEDVASKAVVRYGCWAHARRYFHQALDSSPTSEQVLRLIGRLYVIEEGLRAQSADAATRTGVRREQARPILQEIKQWLEHQQELPKSPLGKAIGYSLNHWEALERYVEEGRIEIDNNLVENAIRPVALGRKNYLFAGSHEAAQRAGIIYSLVSTCKRHGIEPHQWLTDVLNRIPTHPHKRINELLPPFWKNPTIQ